MEADGLKQHERERARAILADDPVLRHSEHRQVLLALLEHRLVSLELGGQRCLGPRVALRAGAQLADLDDLGGELSTLRLARRELRLRLLELRLQVLEHLVEPLLGLLLRLHELSVPLLERGVVLLLLRELHAQVIDDVLLVLFLLGELVFRGRCETDGRIRVVLNPGELLLERGDLEQQRRLGLGGQHLATFVASLGLLAHISLGDGTGEEILFTAFSCSDKLPSSAKTPGESDLWKTVAITVSFGEEDFRRRFPTG